MQSNRIESNRIESGWKYHKQQQQHHHQQVRQNNNGRGGQGGGISVLAVLSLFLKILLWPLHQLVSILFPPSSYDGLTPAATAKAAQAFASHLRTLLPLSQQQQQVQQQVQQYDDHHHPPTWAAVGFNALKIEAIRTRRLIFVYLHSPLHREADRVCRDLLCHAALIPMLRQMSCIGVSIHTGQGAQLAQMLRATSYPLVAVLHPSSSSSSSQRSSSSSSPSSSSSSSSGGSSTLSLLLKVEGPLLLNLGPGQLVAYLGATVQKHQNQLAEEEGRRIQREQEAQLRREQDAEYQAALHADQERQRLQEAREMERLRMEREAVESARREEESRARRLQQARDYLRDEPSSGGTRIRFALSSGRKFDRRFGNDEKVAVLRAYLTLHFHDQHMPEMPNIGLSTTYPKRSYNEDRDNQLTLQEAGLSPQAVLMVQDLDA